MSVKNSFCATECTSHSLVCEDGGDTVCMAGRNLAKAGLLLRNAVHYHKRLSTRITRATDVEACLRLSDITTRRDGIISYLTNFQEKKTHLDVINERRRRLQAAVDRNKRLVRNLKERVSILNNSIMADTGRLQELEEVKKPLDRFFQTPLEHFVQNGVAKDCIKSVWCDGGRHKFFWCVCEEEDCDTCYDKRTGRKNQASTEIHVPEVQEPTEAE